MQWNRANAIGVARASCAHCHGNGLRYVRKGREVPCNCVFRGIFRACWNRFRECAIEGAHVGTVSLEYYPSLRGYRQFGRKTEEYMADFCLVSRRTLDDTQYTIFRDYFLLGADWRLCCRRLKTDRGTFFHDVYRIEQKLGRRFAELRPYPLYPLTEYFQGRRVPLQLIA